MRDGLVTRAREQRIALGLGVTILRPGIRYSVQGWGVEYCDQEWWCDCQQAGTCQHIRAVIEAEGRIAFEEEPELTINGG